MKEPHVGGRRGGPLKVRVWERRTVCRSVKGMRGTRVHIAFLVAGAGSPPAARHWRDELSNKTDCPDAHARPLVQRVA